MPGSGTSHHGHTKPTGEKLQKWDALSQIIREEDEDTNQLQQLLGGKHSVWERFSTKFQCP